MREDRRKVAWAGALSALSFACGLCTNAASTTSSQDFATIERGRYLSVAADCAACHTDPSDPRPFAGGRPIETPFGIVAAANITPDAETGIGDWTDREFDDALRQGIAPDGSRLYPAMPYQYYTRMTAHDVQAIRAYLRTIEPVHHAVITNRLPFPYNWRAVMRIWDALYFEPGVFRSDPTKSSEWNRGGYLVEGAGHCGACHTPKGRLGGDLNKKRFQGYSIQGWFAPNITNDTQRGLGHWSEEDIVDYLRSGHNRWMAASGPMAEEVTHSSSRMTAADLQAIALYLEDQRGQSPSGRPLSPGDPMMSAGSAIYMDLCAACHRKDGTGSAFLIPSLASSTAVSSREPTSILRVVIQGAQSAATPSEPTGPSMPAFGWQLTDAQIAAVTTYIRNSWGHAAAATEASEVSKARRDLRLRSHSNQ